MTSSRRVVIPRGFNYLLYAQCVVAAVAIYASIYVFGVGTIPFILAVVAAGLHFALGMYFCVTHSRPGSYHMYIVPVWLVVCAGAWAGALYYFTRLVELVASLPERIWLRDGAEQPLLPTWARVGCAMSAVNVFIDLILLTVFILSLVKQKSHGSQENFVVPDHVYTTSRAPPQPHHTRQSQLYLPMTTTTDQKSIPLSNTTSVPLPVPTPVPIPVPGSIFSHPPAQQYDPHNRIDTIRRLCALQHPDGHWDYSLELAALVKRWGGREVMAPTRPGVTSLAHACLADLCNCVWTAQREGREDVILSAGEMESFERVHWDLGWARFAIQRAVRWMADGQQ